MFYVVHVRTLNPAAAHVSDLKEPSILGVHFDPYPWGHHPNNPGFYAGDIDHLGSLMMSLAKKTVHRCPDEEGSLLTESNACLEK